VPPSESGALSMASVTKFRSWLGSEISVTASSLINTRATPEPLGSWSRMPLALALAWLKRVSVPSR
jgi:hypothetical protein